MNTRFQSNCLILADICAFYLSFAIGLVVLGGYAGYLASPRDFQIWFFSTGLSHLFTYTIFMAFAIGRFISLGVYQKRLLFWDEFPIVFETVFNFAILHGVTVFIFKSPLSRTLWLASWFFVPFLIIFLRNLTKKMLRRIGNWQLRAVCVGEDELSAQFKHLTSIEPLLGIEIIRTIEIPQNEAIETICASLKNQISGTSADLIVVATQNPFALRIFQSLSQNLAYVHLVPPLQGMSLLGMQTQYFFSHEVFLLSPKSVWVQKSEERLKRIFDVLGASIFLVIFSPVFLVLILSLALFERGAPIFFRQKRHGQNGTLFECLKFRTMVPDAERRLQEVLDSDPIARREWQEKTKISKDPRVTPLGDFLRKTSLDELPQLWNVLRGDMSLVGPRPILLHEDEKYGKDFGVYQKFRPGLTGLWQVSGRSDTTFEYRIFLDTWYVRNWSPWYDFAILFKTIGVMFKKKGAY